MQLRLNDHLEGKLHPATLQLERLHRVAAETAQAAVEIATLLAGKKQAANRT